jgi:hypothetical protein
MRPEGKGKNGQNGLDNGVDMVNTGAIQEQEFADSTLNQG